jgi:SAM-dependent methyltransferase
MRLYAATIFTGAFLLFLVQPLIGKYILPWFGGSPGVWTTCLLFFQALLLGGYAYAHFTSTRLTPRAQAGVHLVLLGVALLWLPIIPDAAWVPTDGAEPTKRILLLLTATLGLPYLLLSATGPLLQRWFHLAHPEQSPYRLYALSNLGSLLALLGYPFLIEPISSRPMQAWGWSIGLAVFVVLCGACAWQVRREAVTPTPSSAPDLDGTEPAPTWGNRLLWTTLPAIASVLLVAMTNKICIDVAVIPFLWVVPLALYLLSFILCFDHPRWYARGVFSALLVVGASLCVYLFGAGSTAPLPLQLGGYTATLFVACMVCHGELHRLRPAPRHLTGFYLHLSIGGALGGLFVAVGAPALFDDYLELPLGLWLLAYLLAVLCLLQRSRRIANGTAIGVLMTLVLIPAWLATSEEEGWSAWASAYGSALIDFYAANWTWVLLVVAALVYAYVIRRRAGAADWRPALALPPLLLAGVLGITLFIQAREGRENLIEASRNFYGTLKVRAYGEPGSVSRHYLLAHGVTTHGLQMLHPTYTTWPTTYYGSGSGIGLAIDHTEPTTGGRHLGLVGLGVGTLAAYGMPGDKLRIYEINPEVLRLARSRFAYLAQTPADVSIVMGDARLSMEQELKGHAPQEFDVLALDAFSSDAIPVHLLTVEAFETYLRHLKPDGIIAVHISNRYLDLRPVVEALAHHFGLHLATISENPAEEDWWLYRTTWILLSRAQERLAIPAIQEAADEPSDATAELVLWTDDHASLLRVLR